MGATYRIEDEPRPGAHARLAVKPMWPLLAVMLAGSWLGFPWFAVNGFLVGSPTRRREAVVAAAGILGSIALIVGIALIAVRLHASPLAVKLMVLAITLWKLALGYVLFTLQSRSFAVYEYYGGTVANGLPVVLLASFVVRPALLARLPGFWAIVLS